MWQLADEVYETVSDHYVPEVWQAWIDSLKRNAPQTLMQLDIGGGKTRTVPRWKKEAGDCENASLMCFAHAMTGNWIGALAGGPEAGRAYGIVFFVAAPRAGNRHRAGGHCVMWWVNHNKELKFFEPGDGEEQPWVPEEFPTAYFGLAA